jgi:hypothetical protein
MLEVIHTTLKHVRTRFNSASVAVRDSFHGSVRALHEDTSYSF